MSGHRECRPIDPIHCRPTVIFQDRFVPQIIPIIHPIEIVERIHCVPVPRHIHECHRRVENNFNDGFGGYGDDGININSKQKQALKKTRTSSKPLHKTKGKNRSSRRK
ncbi:hypothetical protein MH117_07970 [Paenibacillus sp. ACRRX]|uniref:hypothetical protein n=1 Tax=unclassified Paenibacillus TaxID=185978 RepID=UPI001EF5E423|nr:MULTISPECIES: hypothetical protein [unclassified Paenibacillus]MCG7407354.1 hypothetical protein [Paenibacillus sp. ACRRX]MDK8180580.1 hypothetical protein [Paenibacillus sp. UMB4589-SE434]